MHKNIGICFSQGKNSLKSGDARLCLKPGARPSQSAAVGRTQRFGVLGHPSKYMVASLCSQSCLDPSCGHARLQGLPEHTRLSFAGPWYLQAAVPKSDRLPVSVNLADAREGPQPRQVGQRLEQEQVWKVTVREKPVSINQQELSW